ncbi:MAG: hypothetical protein HFJ42_10020 [Clostridia bacterium]|nr:hypothetical protein [Clostridia bacterium]
MLNKNDVVLMEGINLEVKELKCTNGLLKVYEDKVVISRKTAMAFVSQGLKGDKTFFYSDLSSVEYKKPSLVANGYIKFITAGTRETKQNIGILGTTTKKALEDDNTLILRAFNKEVPKKSEELYEYILSRMSELKNKTVITSNISKAEEIMKFKELLDQGIITQEEFEKKKQDLLN